MKIKLERTGGFAGIPMKTEIDTQAVTPQEREGLEQLVENANFFQLPDRLAPPAPGADRFNYKITVEKAGQSHTVEFNEGSAPEPLQTLAQQLALQARRR